MYSIYVDADGCVLSICPDDMTGNTGWLYVGEDVLTERTGKTVDELFGSLFDDEGAPLYQYADGYVEPRGEN